MRVTMTISKRSHGGERKKKRARCKPKFHLAMNMIRLGATSWDDDGIRKPLSKLAHGQVRRFKLVDIEPTPENDRLYRRISKSDPEIIKLARSIKKRGVLEPLLISLDRFIISGHRRHFASKMAGRKTLRCLVANIDRSKSPKRFLALLRECNRQRNKTNDERLRESAISSKPDEPWESLIECRVEQRVSLNGDDVMELKDCKPRSKMSDAKMPLLNAIIDALNALRGFWPTTDRKVHYKLLNSRPLLHASKPNSVYGNNKESWAACKDICTRGRLEGYIPWEALGDETRPVFVWDVHQDPAAFWKREIKWCGVGYRRDLMQSQSVHFEIMCEKNTIAPQLAPIAQQYTIPMTSGRGMCSLAPLKKLEQRFLKSGRDQLVLLIAADHDPSGDTIAESFARRLRDDFGIDVHAIKFALNYQQTLDLDLPPALAAKEDSPTYPAFVKKYGKDCWELEALEESQLQEMLKDAIDKVLDIDVFNAEVRAEIKDAKYNKRKRREFKAAIRDMNWGAK